ncbi:MAG: hypothetical protein AUK47_20845 [Deltaproteobacteria bacterium CG2_30_63_29]|nr:MAG: hypothetical protein AUK47_20845 [Deltaproteobacteria bacterium CG2_30_63_29]PIV98229.1 MAG: photosystem reaction center subunit H [Deltaproteobacteria bacterium CG17_big_fil_post_rev_8_21_14_2_50_63_7]PJB49307.1 MAG: photosystem reaction center subunit H [Deltaproteobacteria bacterium CG_4_9_14_3_um_filter_63_12]
MLRSLKDLESYKVTATDGDLGHVVRFLVDDEHWTVRYLVVQTGGLLFLDGHRVLISPISFREAEQGDHRFHLNLTMAKVAESPNVDVAKPVSRQRERDISLYYNYPYYWGGSADRVMGKQPEDSDASDDVHLRSDEEVRGYHVQGIDAAIGHVQDFIVDDVTWEVRYLVIDTSNWWGFGKSVLVAPGWASHISWAESTIHVALSRQAIKSSPVWNAARALDREYESHLFDHYQRPPYWPTMT